MCLLQDTLLYGWRLRGIYDEDNSLATLSQSHINISYNKHANNELIGIRSSTIFFYH